MDSQIDQPFLHIKHKSESDREREDEPPTIRNSDLRWVIMLLASLSGIADYATNNLIEPFEYLLRPLLDVSKDKFDTLYFIRPEINIFTPLLAGLLIDRFGIKTPYHWFAILVIIGQAIVALGVMKLSWLTMVIGRGISAFGGPCILVARTVIVVKWFVGKELSFALGAPIFLMELGRFAGYYMVLWVWNWSYQLYLGFMTGVVGCCLSWYAVFHLCDWEEIACKEEVTRSQRDTSEPEKLKLKDLKELGSIYYILVIVISLLSAAFLGFTYNPNSLVERFEFLSDYRDVLFSLITFWVPAFVTPFFGLFIDKKGKRLTALFIAFGVFLFANFIITVVPDGTPTGIIAFFAAVIGVSYAIQQAISWPIIAMLTSERLIGTAFGLAYSVSNVALWAWPRFDPIERVGPFWNGMLITLVVLGAIVATYFLKGISKRKKANLEKPSTKRRNMEEFEGRQFLEHED